MKASRTDCVKLIEHALKSKIAPLRVYSISTTEGDRLIATDQQGIVHVWREVLGNDAVVDLTTPQPEESVTMQGTVVKAP